MKVFTSFTLVKFYPFDSCILGSGALHQVGSRCGPTGINPYSLLEIAH